MNKDISKTIMNMMKAYRVLSITNILTGLALIVLVLVQYILKETVGIGAVILATGLIGLFLFRFVLAYQMDKLKKEEFKNMMLGVMKQEMAKSKNKYPYDAGTSTGASAGASAGISEGEESNGEE